MKFIHPQDTKLFILGVVASLTAVIMWDVIKSKKNLFNFKENLKK
tara:strand:- start:165 stop:299 length:135 start_codon:yes stop_codon:yes gene_type:complete